MSKEAVTGDQQPEVAKVKELPQSLEELSADEADAAQGGAGTAAQLDLARKSLDTCWLENALGQTIRTVRPGE